jgi:DNA-binding transcriptional MerR regulator
MGWSLCALTPWSLDGRPGAWGDEELAAMNKNADAFRTISEVAGELDLPQHVLRFWETRFPQIKPLKRAGGRRYYRPRDIEVLRAIKHLLYTNGYTIRGVQRVLKEQGAGGLAAMTDAAEEAGPGFSGSVEQELPGDQCAPMPEFVGAGHGHRVPDRFADPRAIGDQDDAARMAENRARAALGLTGDDIGRLQAALTELVECENILAAARRQ